MKKFNKKLYRYWNILVLFSLPFIMIEIIIGLAGADRLERLISVFDTGIQIRLLQLAILIMDISSFIVTIIFIVFIWFLCHMLKDYMTKEEKKNIDLF